MKLKLNNSAKTCIFILVDAYTL